MHAFAQRQPPAQIKQSSGLASRSSQSAPLEEKPAENQLGESLDAQTRSWMETRFQHDFSRVRVHTDAEAAETARGIGANAFTLGRDIYLGSHRHVDGVPGGRRLLAHELAHVIQQEHSGIPRDINQSPVGQNVHLAPRLPRYAAAEHEAASAARTVADGGSAHVRLSTPTMIARDTAPDNEPPQDLGSIVNQVADALKRKQDNGVGDYSQAFSLLRPLSMTPLLKVLSGLATRNKLDPLEANIGTAQDERARVQVGIAAVKLRSSQPALLPPARVSELGAALDALPQPDQDAVRVFLTGSPTPAPAPPPVNLSTTGPDAFEPGVVQIPDMQKDPKWVENDIVGDQLSRKAPWTFTLTYRDGATLVIPLEQVAFEGQLAGTLTVFRRQKGSGRIIPCVVPQSDPRLKALKGPPDANYSAFADVATPRFDPKTAPTIVSLVNAAQMMFLGTGILEVLQVQAMNPVLGGGAAGGAARAAEGAVAKVVPGAAKGIASATKEAVTFVEIGAGDLRASIDLAKQGGVKVIAVDPVEPAAAAVKTLQDLGGSFVKGVATEVAPQTADHVFQYFPWRITGTGSWAGGGTFRLVEDTLRLLKSNGAAHFVTEEYATAEYLTGEASKRGLKAVITETTAGAAAPGAAGAGVPAYSSSLKVWLVNIYK
jgi:hypothetical protein